MAREPELSIKVKVDPQIKPTELKTSIERKVKQSGEKPQIDIDPNVDGIKRKIEDKLKNIKATTNITPVVDTENLKTDIQQQINGIGDIPKVTVGVNVDDFSDELSKRLKEELKSVNDKLSYYLKNLTTNTAGLNSVVEGLFPSRGISNAVQSELKSVQAELTAGLKGVKSKVKPFKETDLFQIGDTESTTTIRRVEKLVKNVRDQFASLDNFYDADEEKFLDGFNSEFEKFQNNASETVEKLSALKKNLSKDKFSDLLDNEDFDAESTTKALTPLISFLKKLSTTSIKTGEDYDNLYALFNNKNTNKLFDESNDHLTRMKTRVGDITAETKTAIEVTGELAKTLNKAIKDDNSGYLSDAEIKTYGAAFDEVLSNIATKQEEINAKKQRTVELENDLLTKTRSNREALKQELEEYKKLLKSFGVKGDEDEGNPKGKPKPKSKEPDKTPAQKPAEEPKAENQAALNNGIAKIQAIVFDINQEELQKSIDTIFAKVSAPIGFKPANGAIANIKQQLQEAFNDVVILGNSITKDEEKSSQNSTPLSTSISGKVTITDADVIVDVKNPVTIPGTVTVDSTSVQFGNSDDLQKNASALSSVKQSLSKIYTNAEGYGTKIAAIGPSVQYVAQEVDNLSKSLENQITDLDLIAKKTDAYGTTANSVTLNSKDVAAPTAPVDIPGKVTLKVEDVTPPKGSVKILGKVELEVSDITPPKTAVELKGKVSNVTVDDSARGKKKNAKDDVKKPDVIDLKGKVELKDEDIKRPDPLKLNGSVKIKAADVKIDDVEISKKKFDIKGNLILKNAEIVDAVKEAAGKLANIKLGTEGYAKALEDANNKWREAKHLISDFDGEQRDITNSVNNMRNSAQEWLRDITGNTDAAKTLRKTVQGLISDIDNLDSDHSSEAFKTGLEAVKSNYTDAKHTFDSYTNDYKDLEKRANDILSQVRAAKRKLSKAGIDKYDEVLSGESKELPKQKSLVVESSQEKNNVEEIGEQASQVVEDVQKEATVAADVIKDKIEQDVVEIRALIGEHAESLTKPLVEEAEKQYSLEEARAAIHNVIGYRDYAVNKETESYTPNEAKRAFNNLTQKPSSDAVEEIGHFTPEEVKGIISSIIEGTTEAVKQQVDSVSEGVKDLNESAKDTKGAVEDLKQETENIAKSTMGSESSVSGISPVIDHPTVETDNFEARLAALDKLDHQSKEYKDGLEEIIADWELTNKEIDEAISNEKKLNSAQEDRRVSLQKIKDAIEANSKNMDRARKNGTAGEDLLSQFAAKEKLYKALEAEVSSGNGVKGWAQTYFPKKVEEINNVADALREMRGELAQSKIDLAKLSTDKSIEHSFNKAAMEVANLKSQIHDYLDTNKKVKNSELAQPFRDLMNALNSENAPEKISELKKQFAELRAKSKELGLETESLINKFKKLFGTHLGTMITMAALHKMQNALRIVYQNVVEIDTAVTELRKVSEYAGKSLEEYMGRAAEQAQKLGVSISDYINSTADWKRLGYSDEDAENMATYSTLLKNVGDGIDDVNTSSSYLISTLQGFGLLAKDAESVVDQIDKVANTQPITAQAIGEILTRSAASMKAANNDLAETIALGTAAYSVIQNAETVGTTIKSVSMYLRAAKSELEDTGESADGCANSVSELRSELKSLTGVDIMIDNKNFKSTYQILKELSQVWDKLSDVTQANVTEMIGGKRNANAVSAILNNFDVAESAMESAANSAGTAWEENSVWMDSIQGRLAQLDASFQVLSQDVLSSDLVKGGVSFLTSIAKLLDKIIRLTGALPAGLGIATFATQLGKPKMTGFMIVPSNTPGGDTEQACGAYYIKCCSAREYLVKPTNMVA
nr:MAG TPA: minor tail protein [Caudoviricetes sp.]